MVWVINRSSENNKTGANTGTLYAYDAVTLAQLYTSDQAAGGRDALGAVAHFITPTIANGKVYVATQTQLVAYGLLPPAPVTLTPSSLSFGNQVLGTAGGVHALTLTNNNQATALGSIGISVTGDFAQTNTCGTSIPAGSTCTISVSFSPSVTGNRYGSLTVTSDGQPGPLTTSLSGSGVLPTSLTPSSAAFGTITVGAASNAKTFTLTNNQTVALGSMSIVAGGDFSQTNTCGAALAPATFCTISVTFTPAVKGTRAGTLTLASDAPNGPLSAPLIGNGVLPVSLTPVSTNLGNQVLATTSAARTLTLINNQATVLGSILITASGDFSLATSCGASLLPSTNCTISAMFTPTATGTRNGTVTVTSDSPSGPQTASLKGTGVATSILTPLSVNFGNQAAGTVSPTRTVTLTNNQSVPLGSVSISVTGDFGQTSSCGTLLGGNSSCSISVTFTPASKGARTGSLTVTSDAPNGPLSTTLKGTGQ
jgi:hypothetical protein